jgi:peptidoglycan-associated lipoprotein
MHNWRNFSAGTIAIVIAALLLARVVSNEYFFFAGYVVLQFIVLATAWNILGGYCGYVNFGSAAFFAIGAYTYGAAASWQITPDWSSFWEPFQWLGLVARFHKAGGDVVHFQVDSTALTGEAQGILRSQARWLNQYSQYTITLQGHADERGTREYNLALGARRAIAVRAFLASQGVRAARIRTISYGKERPVAVCDDISCWSQNRRAQTVLNNGAVAQY